LQSSQPAFEPLRDLLVHLTKALPAQPQTR
jgi:hypothetical protein